MIRKQRRMRKQDGVVAIEFSLGIFVYLMMIFFWIEVSYMGFVTAMVDYAVAESSRVARSNLDERDYTKTFSQFLKDSDSGWSQFVDADEFVMGTAFFESVGTLKACEDDFKAKECDRTDYIDKPIAIYRVTYPYQPLFTSFFNLDIKKLSIVREVISIQEYERNLPEEEVTP